MKILNFKIQIQKIAVILVLFLIGMITGLGEVRAQQGPSSPTTVSDSAPTAKTHTFVNPIALSFSNAQSALFKGKYLTVYYGYGSPGSLKNQDDQITIREVREKRTYKINASPMKLSQVALKKVAINTAYSIIVFVIHDEPDFTWFNGDRSGPQAGLPKGETVSKNTKFYDTDYLSVVEVETLKEDQQIDNKDSEISYVFGSRF